MTRDVIYRFLDDAAEIGVKAISFVSDGESTCSPHLYDAISRGKKNGLDIALGTNGALLKSERLEEILPSLTYLRFNISAGEKQRYEEIHGCKEGDFEKVCNNIRECVKIKEKNGLDTTIGMQMVLMPQFSDQIMPLAYLGKDLGADYLIIKHCSDDEKGSLGINYTKYQDLKELLEQAERESTQKYLVKAKWSKILSNGEKSYTKCYGPIFIPQLSGSGLIAPCGSFFNNEYNKYHIGNLAEKSFKEIWKSEKYWEVMESISSESFNAGTDCAKLCLQHKVNEYLDGIKKGLIKLEEPKGEKPQHINFI
jgi:MoaA/NifB/PqqE/SkfB family radical SAM enzyme